MKRYPETIYIDGEYVPYRDAKVHILTTAFKYSAIVFDAVRAYWSIENGELYLFRMAEHIERLFDSLRISRLDLDMDPSDVASAVVEVIKRNELKEDLHVRILTYVAADDGSLASTNPLSIAIAPMPMGRYEEFRDSPSGLSVGVSHWERLSDHAQAPRVKTAGNYVNGRLALLYAHQQGYDDAILLDAHGKVTEGPGWNVFLMRENQLITPPVTAGILAGITRLSLLKLAEDLDVETVIRTIDKTELYVAEEAFFCGSAKEVMPIASFDGIPTKQTSPGVVTRQLNANYAAVVRGSVSRYSGWLSPVYG